MKAEDTRRNLQSKSETGYHSSISKIGRSLNDVGAERQAVFKTRRRGVPGIRHRSRGKRVRGGEKCRDRPRKDVLVNRRKAVFMGRSRDVNVLTVSDLWGNLHVLIILKTSK